MKSFIFLFFITLSISVNAQVGIGITSPTKTLDVNGELRIRTVPNGESRTDSIMTVDRDGNVRKINSITNAFLENVSALDNNAMTVDIKGGSELIFGDGGWTNNEWTKIILDEVSDTDNEYDPVAGTFTATADGLYYITGMIVLENNRGSTLFDGEGGLAGSRILLASGGDLTVVKSDRINVIRGITIPGGFVHYHMTLETIIPLKANDVIQFEFFTYGTTSMNTNVDNIKVLRDSSLFHFFKLI